MRPISTEFSWAPISSSPGPSAFSQAGIEQEVVSRLPPDLFPSPVSGAREDIQVLVKGLARCKEYGIKTSTALHDLDGINGYPSQSWMNFYLEYMDEIDRLIARRLEHKRSLRIQIDVTTAPQHLERLGSSIQAAVSNRPRATLAPSVTNPKLMPNTIGRISKRVYARALTPASKPSDRLEGSHSLPASNHGRDKTPSPPGRVIRITSGNLFTPEDTLFCLRFIKYKLARDPGLTVVQLCALLYEKAPHHSAKSWNNHCTRNGNLRTFFASRECLSRNRQSAGGPITQGSGDDVAFELGPKRKRHDHAPKTYNATINANDASNGSQKPHTCRRYSDEEKDALVEHIASLPDSANPMWDSFALKNPTRTAKQWSTYYSANRAALLKTIDCRRIECLDKIED